MSIPLILIKNLVKRNQVWKMLIRVVDFWVVREKTGLQHLELVIQDTKGDQIHVTIHNREFKDWIEQLIEHETYCLYNGEPMVNDGTFEVCPNKLKLVFNGGTIVSKMQIPAIPLHQFKFKAIDDFLNGKFTTDLLYDVVGVLQDVVKTQMGGGGKKSCVNITLGNEAGNVIRVALWEDYAKQFMSYNNSNNFPGPTLLILTHAWLASTQLSITLSTSLTQASQSFVQSGNKNWTNLNEIKSIGQISDTIKDCFTTTIGTTKRFKSSKFGWYFESCPNCKTSNKSHGNKFECVCGVKDVKLVTKYKIEIEVEFDNHVGCFVFWDKDCIPYINMTDRELRQLMEGAGEDNPTIYPIHLDKLLNKKLAFRIKYQSLYGQLSIVTILNEPSVY
ncbi:uncharacterized protein LOC127079384 [Lathyrus oleraceus]|uniref:uncharacterized protein LOC127079384 n=1 Tax=Pisum sativum TaxID=3888 RepID=UPI0021D11760|nr:uncharacterized protein LOC127079384 [Pisum sativum]